MLKNSFYIGEVVYSYIGVLDSSTKKIVNSFKIDYIHHEDGKIVYSLLNDTGVRFPLFHDNLMFRTKEEACKHLIAILEGQMNNPQ